ncbi:MAG: T9SS type A sorting domain-containing protein [Bacteroidales bacterium]|nr:T9SS type A sorting domain-containing protein [Bacteroidales bacterium]
MKLKHFALIISCSIILSINSFGQKKVDYINDYTSVLELAHLSGRVYDGLWDAAMDVISPIFFPEIDFVGNTKHYKKIRVYDVGDFYAVLYQNKRTKKYVLAYRGTETFSLNDWLADLQQALSDMLNVPTNQYTSAVTYAMQVKKEFGVDNVTLTGHSLGGGLAQTAALATGLRAVCFEASGTTKSTLRHYKINYVKRENNKKRILHVNVRWDPLSDFDGKKNVYAPFSHMPQYGAATLWLRAITGTSFTVNPTRIMNHSATTCVSQLTKKKFLGSHMLVNVKAVEEDAFAPEIELTLYPNPASENINIQLNNNETSMVSVISTTGQVVKNAQYFEGETSIDVSGLAAGIYLVLIQNENETIQQRFIKK